VIDYDAAAFYRIVSAHAVCGAFVDGDRIVEIAPFWGRQARTVAMSWRRFRARIGAFATFERLR
jgi:hypothetical protein